MWFILRRGFHCGLWEGHFCGVLRLLFRDRSFRRVGVHSHPAVGGVDLGGRRIIKHDIARDLASVRKAWTTEFLYQRTFHSKTDGQAKAAADERYIERLTLLEAKYEIAKRILATATRVEVDEAPFYQGALNDDPSENPDQEPDAREAEADPDDAGKDCAD